MHTIWAFVSSVLTSVKSKRTWTSKRTWKIVGSATAALIILLSFVGVLSPGLGGLVLVVSFVLGFRTMCKWLRKQYKRLRKNRPIIDHAKDHRVTDKLLLDEHVVAATPEHPIVIVMSIFTWATLIWMGAGSAFGIFIAVKMGSTAAERVHDAIPMIITWSLLGFVGRLVYRYLVWRTDLLVLTNYRLYTVAGFFSREREAIEVKSISGITHKTRVISYIAAWLGVIEEPIGFIKATGIGQISERFKHLPNVEEFARQIWTTKLQAR